MRLFKIGFLLYLLGSILMAFATPLMSQETELQVNISPQGAIDDGAMWRYQEKGSPPGSWSNWWNSGSSLEVYAATFRVEFKDTLSGKWVTPNIREVTISNGEHKIINQTYEAVNSDISLTVTLDEDAVKAGATWSLFYKVGNPWVGYENKTIATDLPSGETYIFKSVSPDNQYYIEYNYIKDLARPYTETIGAIPGAYINISRKYKELVVGAVHIYGNKLEYGNNEFRTKGTTRWAFKYFGGSVESVKYIKCKPNLSGSFSPALITGRGTLHFNEDLGWLEDFFDFFNGKAFYSGKFTLNGSTLTTVSTSLQNPVFDYMAISCTTMDFRLFKNPFGLSQTTIGELDVPIFLDPSVFSMNKFKVSGQDNSVEIKGDVIWHGAEVPGLMKINETEVNIDTSTKTFTAEGFEVEVFKVLPDFRGEIKIKNGVVRKLSAELYDANQQASDYPIVFDNCGFRFENPESKSESVRITAGVNFVVPKVKFDVGGESWEGFLDINGHFKVSGIRDLFGYEIGSTETEVQFKGDTQYVMSNVDALFYVGGYLQFIIEGQGFTYLQWKPDFNFSGWISASGYVPLPDWLSWISKSGQINVPSFFVGIDANGMTVAVNLFDLYTFEISIPPFWDLRSSNNMDGDIQNRDLSKAFSCKTLSSSNVQNFIVNQGETGFVLSLQGNSMAPDAVLIMPDGTRIDPKNYVSPGDSIRVGIDNVNHVTGFIVNDPQPGTWVVELADSTGFTQRLIRGNRPPRLVPGELEKQAGGGYKLTYQAFDADNEAMITFYNSPDNHSFQGIKIGTAIEGDGAGTFIWNPGSGIVANRYICAVIDDGINTPEQVYFNGNIVNPGAPAAPIFNKAHMSGDKLILTFKDLDFSGIHSLKVYYSDDLETENLSEYFTVFPASTIEVNNDSLVPGRKYQLRVTALSQTHGESDFSPRCDIDYKLETGNNHPNIISTPVQVTNPGIITNPDMIPDVDDEQPYIPPLYQVYRYQLNVQDYDNDSISYSIIRGPEQLTVSSSGLIYGVFPEDAVGSKSMVVQVDDGKGGTDTQKFRIHLNRTNNEPVSLLLTHRNNLIINLTDVTRNLKPSMIDQMTTTVQDSITGNHWIVSLQETSADSGTFQGLVQLNPGDSRLRISRKGRFLLRWENGNGKERIYKAKDYIR